MNLPVVLTDEAEADHQEAAQWYDSRSEGLGAGLVAQARELLVRIGDNPSLYPIVHGTIRRASVRRFTYGVFYRRGDSQWW